MCIGCSSTPSKVSTSSLNELASISESAKDAYEAPPVHLLQYCSEVYLPKDSTLAEALYSFTSLSEEASECYLWHRGLVDWVKSKSNLTAPQAP